jgi:D-sedoheptulose 7-phosphate isomerase
MDSFANGTATEMAGHYAGRLGALLATTDWSLITPLAEELLDCWGTGRQVFWIGNGGSAGNATHLSNDFLYPISKKRGSGIRSHALTANAPVITCLANDEGYDEAFAMQLAVLANPGDVLIAFSGSGNSPNILRALEEAKAIGMKTFAILGFSGGRAKEITDYPIHFAIEDMQIAEDMQLIVGHMVMRYLHANRNRQKKV